uniref:DNA-directed DNA polymerase n=1 Tax=Schizaphis graminum TaxID=13262 RepID=A0A2S2PRT3_SCHGA
MLHITGKTMEQVRRRIKVELVSSDDRLRKLINKTTFKHATAYNENLSAITLENKIIKFDKPIYIGLAVLDISKTLMYDYHYNVMKRYYGEKISLMYTDTDSLVYLIETDDFYDDMANNPILLDRMDTANLPRDHPCYIAERKKIPGLFSDETNGDIMTEFCALRSKSYSYKINEIDSSKEEIRAKGIRGHVVKNHMTFEDHKRCLFEGMDSIVNRRPNISIRSFNHQLTTIRTNKITYNNYDDKRVVLEDKVHTLAHGHYRTWDIELAEMMAENEY